MSHSSSSTTSPPRVVITGGSGFLGLSLAEHLAAAGAEVVIVARSAPRRQGPWRHVAWSGRPRAATAASAASGGDDWWSAIDGARAVVNLAGRQEGFAFRFPELRPALEDLYDKRSRREAR